MVVISILASVLSYVISPDSIQLSVSNVLGHHDLINLIFGSGQNQKKQPTLKAGFKSRFDQDLRGCKKPKKAQLMTEYYNRKKPSSFQN
jgi:hypothetical protein